LTPPAEPYWQPLIGVHGPNERLGDKSGPQQTTDGPSILAWPDENAWSAILNALDRKPFGLERVSHNALALVTEGDSDITFYDRRVAIIGRGATDNF
jgi:Protein of unknown function (DUF2860)